MIERENQCRRTSSGESKLRGVLSINGAESLNASQSRSASKSANTYAESMP
jgi:hypothetical protein